MFGASSVPDLQRAALEWRELINENSPSCSRLTAGQRPWRAKGVVAPEERATIASPRTAWSAGAGTMAGWCKDHKRRCHESSLYHPTGSSQLLLLGDSLFSGFTSAADGRQMLASTLGSRWPAPLVFAQGGDETQHLLWRVRGEVSQVMASDPNLLIAVLVGTNNLGTVNVGGGHSPQVHSIKTSNKTCILS